VVIPLSEEAERQYVNSVLETAKSIWGSEVYEEIKDQIERTVKAVYFVSNYRLDPEIEPMIQVRIPKEES
jgi:hypothetical protein